MLDVVERMFEASSSWILLYESRAQKWGISGPAGAAARLRLKPTTLHSKMKKLGTRRPRT